MGQLSLSDMEYSQRKRVTRREEFLDIMDEIIPWEEWVSLIVPHYPSGKRGRPPVGMEIMLRMYLLQCWFHLSDEGVEDAIYDSYAMRKFMGINFLETDVPDATTLLKFRHLLERHGLGKMFFDAINRCLEKAGRMMRGGSIVDATLISAPSSTKNANKARDPEMHQTKKGNQWYFGMKCHIGVDAGSGFVHTVTATAPVWGSKNGRKSVKTLISPPLTSASTAGRAVCPGFRTTPLTGNEGLKAASPLYAVRESIRSG